MKTITSMLQIVRGVCFAIALLTLAACSDQKTDGPDVFLGKWAIDTAPNIVVEFIKEGDKYFLLYKQTVAHGKVVDVKEPLIYLTKDGTFIPAKFVGIGPYFYLKDEDKVFVEAPRTPRKFHRVK